MALSGSYTTNSHSNSGVTRSLTFSWSATQNIGANTSTVTWTLKGSGTASGWMYGQRFNQTVNGVAESSATRIKVTSGLTVLSGSTVITHNADGTKTFSANTVADLFVYGTGNIKGSGSWALDTIPRTSEATYSSSDLNVGSTLTLYTNRASTAFTHIFYYKYGSGSWTQIASGITTSYAWVIPTSFANWIPSTTAGSLSLLCETYSGGTYIGGVSSTMTFRVPNNGTYQPSVGIMGADEGNPSLAGLGTLIANYSQLRVTSSSSGKSGAWITEHKVTVDRGGGTHYGGNILSSTITSVGTITVTVRAQDSRGFATQISVTTSAVATSAISINVSSQALGSVITISSNRPNAKMTHTFSYRYPGNGWITAGSNQGVSQAFTLPYTLANYVPNGTSGTVDFYCDTYYNGYSMGGSLRSITFTIPNNSVFQPTAVINSVAEAVGGLAAAFGLYIKDRSKLYITTSGTTKYGATMSSRVIAFDGYSYNGPNVTTNFIRAAGTITLTNRDSRGFVSTATHPIAINNYYTPKILGFSSQRHPNKEGVNAQTLFNFDIATIASKNSKNYKIEYKDVASSVWTQLVSVSTLYNANSSRIDNGIFITTKAYQVRLTVSDYFTATSQTVTVGTGYQLMNFNQSGKGVAFGKVSENDGFEVDMPTKFYQRATGISANGVSSFLATIEDTGSVDSADTRNVSPPPEDLPKGIGFKFRSAEVAGLNDGGTYVGVMDWRMYGSLKDFSGGPAKQIAYTGAGNLWHREGTNTSWGSWRQIMDQTSMLNMVYPVGAIYISTVATNPASLIGGTWVAFGAGRTLVGFNSGDADFNAPEKVGGSKTHTLTTAELASHSHTGSSNSTGAHTHTISGTAASSGAHTHYNRGYYGLPGSAEVGSNRRAVSRELQISEPIDTGGPIQAAGEHTHTISGTAASNGAHSHTITVSAAGSGTAHNNMQPYITTYMFKRTA